MSNQNQLDLYVRTNNRNQKEIIDLLKQILQRAIPLEQAIELMATTVDDLVAKVTAQTTVVNSVKVVVDELKAIIASGQTDPAKLQQINDVLDANDAILEGISTGTVAAGEPPAPVVEPPTVV